MNTKSKPPAAPTQHRVRRGLSLLATSCLQLILALPTSGETIEVLPPDLRGAIQPQVAVTPAGRILLTFGKDNAVYFATSTNGGKSFLRPVEVDRLPKLALGRRRGPRIVGNEQQVTISAISHATGNLYGWTSHDGGATWSRPVIINSATNAAREGLHGMAGDGHGNVYVVWLDLRNKGTQLWGAASIDGGKSWKPDVMVYQSPDGSICQCCHPSANMSVPGMVRVLWRNALDGARDMFVAVSKDGGATFAAAEKLGTGTWPLNGCPMDGGSLAGSFTVWRRADLVFFTDDQPGEHLLGRGSQPVVALRNEEPCFVWQDGSTLMWNKGLLVRPTRLAQGAGFPAIANGPKGRGLTICWESMTNGVPSILAKVLD